MKVRRGEVVIVDFPYSDQTGRKVRPALVVQSNVWNQRLDDTILALITGSRHRRVGATTQYFVDISTDEGQQTGLSFDSVIIFNITLGMHPSKVGTVLLLSRGWDAITDPFIK